MENHIDLIIRKNSDVIAKDVANFLTDYVKNNPHCVLGLATGSTPVPTYKKIIEMSKEKGVSFKNVTTFNLDEYCGIDAKNEQSYRYFMNENLFKSLDFKDGSHHFPLKETYEEYDNDIANFGGIDMQILGIGGNGHIAFNEPGTSIDSKTHITELTEKTIKDNSRFFNSIEEVPTSAITMGLSTILASRIIILIATGKNKAEAIKGLMSGKYNAAIPASALNLCKNKVYIYCDEDAASLLK